METLPTAGCPRLMRNWTEYIWLLNHMVETGFIKTIREIWWDVRPHHNFGTVEVRICDMPPTSPRARPDRASSAWSTTSPRRSTAGPTSTTATRSWSARTSGGLPLRHGGPLVDPQHATRPSRPDRSSTPGRPARAIGPRSSAVPPTCRPSTSMAERADRRRPPAPDSSRRRNNLAEVVRADAGAEPSGPA